MKIMILGSTGMLGNAVFNHFKKEKYEVFGTYRNQKFSNNENFVFFDAASPDFSILKDFDYVLNCIGVIKPFMNVNMIDSIFINSIFPRQLANYCEMKNIKLIHITTDCVFSGIDSEYDEDSLHDCLDEYGKSKSLGEPTNCMVIRTSIIGEEIHKNASLISWVKSMKNKEINGFINHLWNGVTTKHYAELCQQIIENDLHKNELFIVHSNTVNKFELLSLLNDKFELNLSINKFEDKKRIDRTLSSKKDLINKLKIKSIQQQIEEL